jgi:phage tail-like protein
MPASEEPLGGDLPVATHFLFEVDGVEIGMFSQVQGLTVMVGTHEIREGGQNGFVRKVPGRMTWPNLVFRRGVTKSDNLFAWISKSSGEGFAANKNSLQRVTGAVTALGAGGVRLRAWEFMEVFPVRWQGPEFATGSQSPLEEELEVAHHGFRAQTQAGGA